MIKPRYLLILLALTGLYAYFTLTTPIDTHQLAKYNISTGEARWLDASIIFLIFLVYLAAFYGFGKFKDYAETIKDRADGKHLAVVANGLEVLAIGLVLNSVLSSLLTKLTFGHLDQIPRTVIIENYVNMVVAAAAYYLVYRGARGLARLAKAKQLPILKRWWLWLYAVVGAGYIYDALTSPDKNTPATSTAHGLYYLPNVLLLVTVLLPIVAAWFFGFEGIAALAFYRRNTKGTIYKTALQALSRGLGIVIGVSIGLQFLTIVAERHSAGITNASLNTILAFLYCLIAVIGVGFLVIARGAKKLKLIEEV